MEQLQCKDLYLWLAVSSMFYPINFAKPMKGINISVHKKTDMKYGQLTKFTMPQALIYHNRYTTIPDTYCNDKCRSKRETNMMSYIINDMEYQIPLYQNQFCDWNTESSFNTRVSLHKNYKECIFL